MWVMLVDYEVFWMLIELGFYKVGVSVLFDVVIVVKLVID